MPHRWVGGRRGVPSCHAERREASAFWPPRARGEPESWQVEARRPRFHTEAGAWGFSRLPHRARMARAAEVRVERTGCLRGPRAG